MAGARHALPLLATVVPLAIVIGATARQAGIDHLAAWAASFLLVAGAAQLAMIQLLGDGASTVVVIATIAVINARFILYSVGVGRWFAHEPLRRRLVLAFPLVDQLYLVCAERFDGDEDVVSERRSYFLGAAVVLVGGWTVTQALSMLLAGSLPASDLLAAAAPIAFAGLLATTVRGRPNLVAAIVSGGATVAVASIAPLFALLAGIAAGIGAASLARRASR